ncbi:MAG: PilZ domain-containing protein [Lachnospiraceae bacterium]|nr:PilZ domain-containing protein [Lachnospiraceae bacterium]
MSEERRREKRMDIDVSITIRRLGENASDKGVQVKVLDLSKGGIGFSCAEKLESGAAYAADIKIWTGDIIHSIINVVRVSKGENESIYGGVFIGMPESEWCRIQVYETYQDYDEFGKKDQGNI